MLYNILIPNSIISHCKVELQTEFDQNKLVTGLVPICKFLITLPHLTMFLNYAMGSYLKKWLFSGPSDQSP